MLVEDFQVVCHHVVIHILVVFPEYSPQTDLSSDTSARDTQLIRCEFGNQFERSCGLLSAKANTVWKAGAGGTFQV